MNWPKAIGYGIALFAIMFVIGSIVMFTLKVTDSNIMGIIMLIAAVIVLWLLAGQYKIGSLMEGIQVGIIWLIVDVLLEYLVVVQTFNKGNLSFYTWSVLIGYALVVIVPALAGQMKK